MAYVIDTDVMVDVSTPRPLTPNTVQLGCGDHFGWTKAPARPKA